jgi:hypothetical protein
MEKVKLLALTLVMFAATARAQPQDDAKAHFKRGTELYDENNFRGALVEFQKAYELAPSYKLLFNIGQVEMELQDYAGAVKAYSRYLREGGPDVPPPRVQQVQAEIDRLRGRIGHVTIQTAPGAEVLIDEVSIGFAPLPEPATVNAGRHTITIHVTGRDPQSRAVDVAGQEQVTVVLGNELTAPTQRVDEPAKPRGKTPMYVAWGATGVFAVAAGVFAYTAHNDSGDLAKLRTTFPVTKAQLDSAASKTTTAAALTDGFTAGAVIAGGVALYLTLTQPPARTEKAVRLHVTPTGAYVAGQF